MRVFISADMEGVAGVVHDEQTDPANAEYRHFRELMVAECNAAIEGALEAGAQEIVVNDSHWNQRNLLPQALHPRAELVSGRPNKLWMCEGMGPGFDAAFLVGYHASAGTRDAVLPHTYAWIDKVQAIRLNGTRQSEGSLNGYVCGYFDCPVALFTGDAPAVSEMHGFVTEVEGVVVKEGLGPSSGRSLAPVEACSRIRTGAARALERLGNIPPLVVAGRADMEIDFAHPGLADRSELVWGVKRLSDLTVGFGGDDYLEVFKLMLALVQLAGAA
jgi:D-amino peptidase